MDNFMDKLAEKYNAQDMIRANAQAESAQMQSLEEQVEAYEAVLQEMRKLNYKNTELTEKMYALVDESIERVRTLQIEAQGGANAEQVSKEMTDAVSRAVGEAVSNMDETMVHSLTEAMQNALQQPTEEIRQSTQDVRESVVAVQTSTDTMRSSMETLQSSTEAVSGRLDELQTSTESVRGRLDYLQSSTDSVRDGMDSIREGVEALRTEVNELKSEVGDLVTDFELKSDLEEGAVRETPVTAALPEELNTKLDAVQGTVTAATESLDAIRKDAVSIGDSLDSLKSSSESVSSKLDAIRSTSETVSGKLEDIQGSAEAVNSNIDGLRDSIFELKQTGTNTEESLAAISAAIKNMNLELAQELADQSSTSPEIMDELKKLAERLEGLGGKVDGISDALAEPEVDKSAEQEDKVATLIEELKQQAQIDELTQETLSALAQSNAQTQDSLTELKAVIAGLRESNEQDKGNEELKELVKALQEAGKQNNDLLQGLQGTTAKNKEILQGLQGADAETKASVTALQDENQEQRKAMMEIFDTLIATKNELAEMHAAQTESSRGGGLDEELRQTLSELSSANTDLKSSFRTLKASTDENKNTLKSAIDSSIYGLKQDNKEIVEFMQRMNANLMKQGEEAERAAQRDAEALAKSEEAKQALEERFKAAEDFMHKESVKVYRNVQAVINEKNDKQKESVENANLSVEKRVGKVKALIVINMVFTLINLATMILYIFGFLGGH